jgi:hypothetical protein
MWLHTQKDEPDITQEQLERIIKRVIPFLMEVETP